MEVVKCWIGILCMMILWVLMGSTSIAAEQSLETTGEYLLKELDLGAVQRELEEELELDLKFEETVLDAVEGKTLLPFEKFVRQVAEEVKNQWEQQKKTFFMVLTLAVCAALLANFSGVFKSQQIAEVGFEITYMLLFLILLGGYRGSVEVTTQVLSDMEEFMRALVPAYFLSVTLASGSVTAGVFYPFLLGLIHVIRWIMEVLLLPLSEGYVVLVFVNHLTKEKYLSRLSEGILSGCGWFLKTMLAVVTGFHLIQGMISPAVDAFRTTVVGKTAAAIPAGGNLAGSVADVILGSGMLIKNGIGVAGLLVLIAICLIPLVRIGCWVMLLEVLAAVIQPVSDKRLVGCIAGISDGGKLLFRMVFTVSALFMLSIALVAVCTGVRV